MNEDTRLYRSKMALIMNLAKGILASPTLQRLAVPVGSGADPVQWVILDENYFDQRAAEANKARKGRYRSIRLVGDRAVDGIIHTYMFVAMLVESIDSISDPTNWMWQAMFLDIVGERRVRGFRMNEFGPGVITLPFNNFNVVPTTPEEISEVGSHASGLVPAEWLTEAHVFVREMFQLCSK